jgi:hypothetical protein
VKDVGKLKPRLRCATGDQVDAARPYQSRVVQSAAKMFHESGRKKIPWTGPQNHRHNLYPASWTMDVVQVLGMLYPWSSGTIFLRSCKL